LFIDYIIERRTHILQHAGASYWPLRSRALARNSRGLWHSL